MKGCGPSAGPGSGLSSVCPSPQNAHVSFARGTKVTSLLDDDDDDDAEEDKDDDEDEAASSWSSSMGSELSAWSLTRMVLSKTSAVSAGADFRIL
jgi:hypothetical protein